MADPVKCAPLSSAEDNPRRAVDKRGSVRDNEHLVVPVPAANRQGAAVRMRDGPRRGAPLPRRPPPNVARAKGLPRRDLRGAKGRPPGNVGRATALAYRLGCKAKKLGG